MSNKFESKVRYEAMQITVKILNRLFRRMQSKSVYILQRINQGKILSDSVIRAAIWQKAAMMIDEEMEAIKNDRKGIISRIREKEIQRGKGTGIL